MKIVNKFIKYLSKHDELFMLSVSIVIGIL